MPVVAVAQTVWNSVNSPFPGVESVAVDASDENILYVTSTSGVYVTADGGTTWNHPVTGIVQALILDPRFSGRVYAAANDLTLQSRIYVSLDHGHSWNTLSTIPEMISSMTITHDGVLIAAPRNTTTASGVYRSTDGGMTWTHYTFPTTFLNLICWDIGEDPISGFVYVGSEIANHPQPYRPPFFRSRDGGKTWEDITGVLPWHVVRIQIVNQVVYALTEGAGLFVSKTFGDQWQFVDVPFYLTLQADPFHPGVMYGGGQVYLGSTGGAFISKDGGQTWSPFGLAGKVVARFAFNGQGTHLYVSAYGTGLFYALSPGASGLAAYYLPHLAFGGGFQTTLTYVNYSPQPVSCQSMFYSDAGTPLQIPFSGGAVSDRTDNLAAGSEIHVQTQAAGNTTSGWGQVQCTAPIKASSLYRLFDAQGRPISEAAVNATSSPATEFVTFAETNTGIAYANPSTVAAGVTLTALDSSGLLMGTTAFTLAPKAHLADNVVNWLHRNFTGSVQINSTVPIVSLSLNAEAFPAFSSLPPGDLPDRTPLASGH